MTKNYKNLTRWSIAVMLMLTGVTFALEAQQKVVKVKVVTDGDSSKVKVDTTVVEDVMVFHIDGESKYVNIDSIVKAHTKDIEKNMKVMAFKMDSLADMDFDFHFDGDMEKVHIQMEKLLKEKGIELEELEKLHKEGPHKMIFIEGGEGSNNVDVETFIDEDGNHVKVIKREINVNRGDDDDETTYVIKSGKGGKPIEWHSKATIKIEPIPMEEVAFLKKIGISTKKLLNEPLEIKDFRVKIEKKIENELKQTLLHIECVLPDGGNYNVEMIKKDGEVKSKEENVPSGEMKKEYEVKEEEAPYYLILSKNNQLFGRKITL